MNIESLVRDNIKKMNPYSSARSLYTSGTLLDANENPFNLFSEQSGGIEVNRYPEGNNKTLREKIALLYGFIKEQVAVGNGSDELIDLLMRIFCDPGKDEILIAPPTYGMFNVVASIQNVKVLEVPLVAYEIDVQKILKTCTPHTKIIFLCNPNNPTGTIITRNKMLQVVKESNCIVVVDEAYGDFMEQESMMSEIPNYPNLVVLKTFSKAFALAGARLGVVFSNLEIIQLIQKVKFPYNINSLTTEIVLFALDHVDAVKKSVNDLIGLRQRLKKEIERINGVLEILPSETNFLCVKFKDSKAVFYELINKGVIVRKIVPLPGFENWLRISVGSQEENTLLIAALKQTFGNRKEKKVSA